MVRFRLFLRLGYAWCLCLCSTLAQSGDEHAANRISERSLASVEREILRMTTEWTATVRYNRAFSNATSEKLVQQFRQEQERILRDMARAENRDEEWVKTELDRQIEHLRKSIIGSERELTRTVVGSGTFWMVHGDLCSYDPDRTFAKREAVLPGSAVIESETRQFKRASAATRWSAEVASTPLIRVLPDYNTTLLSNSLLLRVFILGESPFRWIDLSKARVARTKNLVLIEAEPLRRPPTQKSSVAKPPALEVENIHQLRDRWRLDTTRGYRVVRYESAFGDVVVEVLAWRKYRDLWIPETVKLTIYKGQLQVVYDRQTGKYKAVPSATLSEKGRQLISESIWNLKQVKPTTQPSRLEDHLHSDRVLQDLRLGIDSGKVVGYIYDGSLPSVDVLEEMYKQQQAAIAEREKAHSSDGLLAYAYILPVLLILIGVYWLYRRKRLQPIRHEP